MGLLTPEPSLTIFSTQKRGNDLFILHPSAFIPWLSGRNSMVECRLPKPDVAGSIPVARSTFSSACHQNLTRLFRVYGSALNFQ
jgi:hypothetical protein